MNLKGLIILNPPIITLNLIEKMIDELSKYKHKMIQRARFCAYCDKKLRRNPRYGLDYPTLEHQVPKSKGGDNTPDNLVIVCGQCNRMKADMIFKDFIEHIGSIYRNLTGINDF